MRSTRDVSSSCSCLRWPQRQLADAFAGQFPAPGGAFRLGEDFGGWVDTEWGPLLAGASSWLGARLSDAPPVDVGWAACMTASSSTSSSAMTTTPLEHRRGRYRTP